MESPKFDAYSGTYRNLLDRAVSVSGESSQYFAEYKALYIKRLLGPAFRGKVLDFGCGVGMLAELLKKHMPAASIHGYDISSRSIEMVDQALRAQGRFHSDLGELDHDYAAAVISNVMHHVPPPDRQKVIASIAEKLAPSGHIIVFEHNPYNPVTQRVVKQCPFDDDAILLPPREVKVYILGAELRAVRRDYIVFFPRLFSWLRRLEPGLRWLPAGAQYAFVGKKNGN